MELQAGVRHYLILLRAAHVDDVFFLEFIYCFAEVEKKAPTVAIG